MKNALVGFFFFIGLVMMGWLSMRIGCEGFFGGEFNRFVTRVDNANSIAKGDAVYVAGVKAGHVSGITVEENKVKIDLLVDTAFPVRKDSTVQIRMTSAMGGKHVEVSLGAPDSPRAETGDELESETGGDIDDLVVAGEHAFREFGKIGPRVTRVLDSVQQVVDKLNRKEDTGSLGKLINNPEIHDNLAEASVRVNTILQYAEGGKGTVAKLLKDEKMAAELDGLIRNLNQVIAKINSGKGTLGKLVNDDKLLAEAQRLLKELREAIEDQREQAPINAFTSIIFGAVK